MAMFKAVKWAVILMIAVSLAFFILTVKTAGQIRQARFNIMALYHTIVQYKAVHNRYPQRLSALPKFYVVSVMDRLYFDSAHFTQNEFDGYRYELQLIDPQQFALSASPKRLWPIAVEYGITEEGNLKANEHRVDREMDPYPEIRNWDSVKPNDFKE